MPAAPATTMKIKEKTATVALAILIGIQAGFATDLTLTREECIGIALDKSPTVRIADVEIKKSDYSKRETLAKLFPQIDFSLSYSRSIELQTLSMDFGGQSQKIKMGTDNNWNTGFSASMPLIAPTLWKALAISDTQILQNLESARASRLDLALGVSKAYYGLMLALASKEVLKQQYDISTYNSQVYQKQFEQGTASEYDVLRSSVQVKNLEPELLQADIAIKQCRLQLAVLMGIDQETVVIPASGLEECQQSMRLRPTDGYSLAGNTSMRSLELQTKMADQNITMKKFDFLPTLGASFNLNWSSISNGSPFRNQEFNPYCNVGVALSIPIFSGLGRYNAVRQAQATRTELQFQRENLENTLNMQAQLAIETINLNAKQIDSSKEGMVQARKANQIMQKSFEIGAASYLELRDSELANTSANLMYLQAIHNYLVSVAELDNLLGNE